jgi:hypothetical protein
LRSALIGVHPDSAKVVSEAWLEERPCGGVERFSRRREHVLDNRRRYADPATVGAHSSLHLGRRRRHGSFPLLRRFRHPHHLLRHPVRFPLHGIAGLADC